MKTLKLIFSFFFTDLRRIFTEPTFFTSLLLGSVALLAPFFILPSSSFVTAQSAVFPFAAPFLAALPFAAIYKTERETKYADLLKIRRGGKSYAVTRFFTVGIGGGFALMIPEILLLAVSFFINNAAVMDDLFRINYTLALSFPFGFVFAALAYAMTFITRSKIIAIITPEVLYLLFTYAFPYLDLEKYYPPFAIAPFIYGVADLQYIYLMFAAMFIVSLIITIIFEILTVKES
ncbi:MAG: hypothetical protein LBM41_07115 [Ruminococcus sp.]|jgi:hypothetical protein|nr:hypothetical protein [Ruminococcus sp.]